MSTAYDTKGVIERTFSWQNTFLPSFTKNLSTNIDINPESNVPNIGNIWLKTWGCTHNQSDGEYMQGQLNDAGYTIVDNNNDADIWILNSCTVKNASEAHLYVQVSQAIKNNKSIVLTGCVPQADEARTWNLVNALIDQSTNDKSMQSLNDTNTIADIEDTINGIDNMSISSENTNTLSKNARKKQAKVELNRQRRAIKRNTNIVNNKENCSSCDCSIDDTLTNDQKTYDGIISMLGVEQTHRIVEVVESTLRGESMVLQGTGELASPRLPKVRKNKLIEIIPINTGCQNNCTYCKTKLARGEQKSYSIPMLVERVEEVLKENVKEIWLTSEDLGAYGRDINVTLPKLLDSLLPLLPKGVMIRLGMTNPPYILEFIDEQCEILQHPNVYSFIHIPVQSGSNDVLRDMRRCYTCEEFSYLCDILQTKVKDITIATDVICGYPTETEEDWEQTMDLCKKYKFPILFINQFSKRPLTAAASLQPLPSQVVKARTKEQATFFSSYTTRDKYKDTIQNILVVENSTDQKYLVGHTKSYDQVQIERDSNYLGKVVEVYIYDISKHYMWGRVIRIQDHL